MLAFHKMGEYKWEAMGRDCRLYDIQEPTPDMVARAKTRFEDEGGGGVLRQTISGKVIVDWDNYV